MENQPERERSRAPAAWLLLGLLFTTLIGLQVLQLRTPALDTKDNRYLEEEATVRVGLKMRALSTYLGRISGSKQIGGITAIDEDTLASLKNRAAADPKAARLYVSAKFEAGQQVSEADLESLVKSNSIQDRQFAEIYRVSKLDAARAENLTRNFPNGGLEFALSKVHAYDKAGIAGPRNRLSPPWEAAGLIVVLLGLLLCMPLGVLAWVLYFHFRSSGLLQPKGHPAEPLSDGEADRFAYRSFLLVGAFLTISLLTSQLSELPTATRLFLSYGLMAGFVILAHRLPVLGMPIPLSRIGIRRQDLGKNLVWGIAGYVAALPVVFLAALIGRQLMEVFGKSSHPATQLMGSNPSPATVLALFFAAAVVAPFWEEIMFRGTLLPALAQVLRRPVWAILVSSFMFAAIHPQGIPLWLGLGFIGAMNCMLAYQTRSLVPSIVLHFINNGAIILLTVFLF